MQNTQWKMLAAAAVGAGLMFLVGQAQQRAAGQPPFTAQDYVDIQQLIARYTYVLDTCSNDGYDYADLYTDDGTFIDLWSENGVKEGGIEWQGRDKLAEAAGGGALDCTKTGVINHFLVNHVITPSPEGATGRAYLLWGRGSNPEVVQDVIHKGDWYDDLYAKTRKGWRFKQRTHARDKARVTGVFLPGVYPVGDPRGKSR
jgi:hypothetical protein